MRKFKSNQDVYGFAEELIVLGKEHEDEETMLLLQHALQASSMTSEVLGELRFALERIQKGPRREYLIPIRDDLRRAIRAIRKAFNKANRPF